MFAYDKTKLTADKLPKSMLDLADPSWKGRWAASPSGADFQAIVGALLELKGEAATAAWLKAMKANFTRLPRQQRRDEGGQCRRDRGRA